MAFRKAIALILVLAIVVAGGYYLLKVERKDDDHMCSLYTEVEPLERECEPLLHERAQLETDFALKSRDYGATPTFTLTAIPWQRSALLAAPDRKPAPSLGSLLSPTPAVAGQGQLPQSGAGSCTTSLMCLSTIITPSPWTPF